MRQIMIDDSVGFWGHILSELSFGDTVSKRLHNEVKGPILSATLRHSLDN